NLYESIPITFGQAALGAEVKVQTLNGDESLKIPAGTQTGTVFRVRGQGMPVLGGRGKGDLFVSVSVITPTSLTREQRKLLEQLARDESNDLEGKKLVNKDRDICGALLRSARWLSCEGSQINNLRYKRKGFYEVPRYDWSQNFSAIPFDSLSFFRLACSG